MNNTIFKQFYFNLRGTVSAASKSKLMLDCDPVSSNHLLNYDKSRFTKMKLPFGCSSALRSFACVNIRVKFGHHTIPIRDRKNIKIPYTPEFIVGKKINIMAYPKDCVYSPYEYRFDIDTVEGNTDSWELHALKIITLDKILE